MMAHKLIVNQSIISDDYRVYEAEQHYSLFYQMTRLSKDKNSLAHDDRLDALTMAAAYWLDRMDTSEEDNADSMSEQMLEDMLEYGILASKLKPRTNQYIHNIAELKEL